MTVEEILQGSSELKASLEGATTRKAGELIEALAHRGAALSDREIREGIKEKRIFISPFNEANLANSSYDLTLGRYYYREKRRGEALAIYNPYDPEDVERVWGGAESFETAVKVRDWQSHRGIELKNIPDEGEIILIDPGETIIAHTAEFVGGNDRYLTTMMKARSSVGRNFILVCKCAGWGDIGYCNRWTMEITNCSTEYTIPLVVGWRYAQLVFIRTGGTDQPYYRKGKYQTAPDFDQLKSSWYPGMILPKLFDDREVEENLP